MEATHRTAGLPVEIRGESLTIDRVAEVARRHSPVQLSRDSEITRRIQASNDFVVDLLDRGEEIYGVTTGVGASSHLSIPRQEVEAMQNNLVYFLKTGAGGTLPTCDVRAGMLLRLNSLARGVSGVRLEVLNRLVLFLNENVTPLMHEFGSIGASGDLVPLAYLAGSLFGTHEHFRVDFKGDILPAREALDRLGLSPEPLQAKEGLALINGTSIMTGVAALAMYDARALLKCSMGAHALFLQALGGSEASFHPFIQEHKPHPGQIQAARAMLGLLEGSGFTAEGLRAAGRESANDLFQDRYSLRCLPQYMGPIVDALTQIGSQVETEINSANDNPLLDVESGVTYNGGNFLGQYIGAGMDQLRYQLGQLAKHLDTQIALLVAPEFNAGLPPSLIGNQGRSVNMGLKSMQIVGNSIMPLLGFLGNSIADRYPTHAEAFNQNINSQGFNSANLARESVRTFKHYMAVALTMGVQGVDLRTRAAVGHFDARALLSPGTVPLYTAFRDVVGVPISQDRPYLWDDTDIHREAHLAAVTADLMAGGTIVKALEGLDHGALA